MLDDLYKSLWNKEERPNPVEWCESALYLKRFTDYPGAYSTSVTPYVREILNNFADESVSDMTLCFGSQTGKTMSLMAGMAYLVKHESCPMLFVMHSTDFARSFVKTRWLPTILDSPELAAEIPENKDDFTHLEQHYNKCTVNFVGSSSPGNLSSRPIKFLLCDEVDKYPSATQTEAKALELAIQRTKSFDTSKRIFTSTPTTETGDIWALFLEGDQRYFYIPSPHTGEYFAMVWSGVKWDESARGSDGCWDYDKVKKSAYYECPFTGKKISDVQKIAALAKGEWRLTNPKAPSSKRSYHLSSLYSPWKSSSFGELAVKFLLEKQSPAGLRGFVNGYLAEPFREYENTKDISFVETDYKLGEKWDEATDRFLTVDVQQDHLWAVIRDWAPKASSRLVFEGRVETFSDLLKLQRDYGVPEKHAFIDSGYDTATIYEFCATNNWFAVKGTNQDSFPVREGGALVMRPYSDVSYPQAFLGKDKPLQHCELIKTAVSQLKDVLARLIQNSPRFPGDPDAVGNWTIAKDVSYEYKVQMNAEKKVKVKNKFTKKESFEWVEIVKRRNHLWDCEVMQVAVAAMVGLLDANQSGGGAPTIDPLDLSGSDV